jgi:adenosylhomocysteine nucleosidase
MKTLLVVPTEREANALGARKAFVSGAGPAAYDTVRARLAESCPGLVLVAGVCGGLDPSIGAGGVIVARHVIAPGCDVIEPDRFLLDDIRKALHEHTSKFVYSRLLTVDAPLATRDQKRDAWNEHGAGGVDMETYHIARAAREAGVRWLAVRAVVDIASQALPASLADWDAETGDSASLRRAVRRPWEWPAYARLARQFPLAIRSLRATVPLVIRAANAAKSVETLSMVEVAPK